MKHKRLKVFGFCWVFGWCMALIGLPLAAVGFFIIGLIAAFCYVASMPDYKGPEQ